jgi:hypothetical protein
MFRDNDGIYGDAVSRFLVGTGIEEVKTAYRSPWQNPFESSDKAATPLVPTENFIPHLSRLFSPLLGPRNANYWKSGCD